MPLSSKVDFSTPSLELPEHKLNSIAYAMLYVQANKQIALIKYASISVAASSVVLCYFQRRKGYNPRLHQSITLENLYKHPSSEPHGKKFSDAVGGQEPGGVVDNVPVIETSSSRLVSKVQRSVSSVGLQAGATGNL